MIANKLDAWARNCIIKRTPDSLSVLTDLLEAGLRKGSVTANDIRDKGFSEPNVIGATFRLLPGCGFYCDHAHQVKAIGKKKHGRLIPTWVLKEHWKARYVLKELRNVLIKDEKITVQELF